LALGAALVAGAPVALDDAFAAVDLKNITLTPTPARDAPHQDIIRVASRLMGPWPPPHGATARAPSTVMPPSVMPAKAGIQ